MFGSAKTQDAIAKATKPDPIDHKARLQAEADAMAPEVMALQPEWLKAYRAEHRADAKSYTFDCRKFGDFLSLFIARPSNTGAEYCQPRDMAATLNLRDCKAILLVKGHAPDLKAPLELSATSAGWYGSNAGMGVSYSPDSRIRMLEPARLEYGRPLLALPTKKGSGQNWQGYQDMGGFTVSKTGAARLAEDDRIEFRGNGSTLYVPFGRGQEVLDRILAELAKPA